jgi:hypothetical protein
MCGIAGVHVKSRYKGQLPLDNILDYFLVHIAERGRHATGFVAANYGGKGVTLDKKPIEAKDFIEVRNRPNMDNVQTILAHTRYATQGPKEDFENNHPVVFGTTFATHNGHINNDDDVLEEFDLDKKRPAAVDSIAIPVALASCGMDSIANIQKGLGKLGGNMACAVIDPIKHPGQLILAKGSMSPLILLHHRTGFYWASTKAAIEFVWGSLIGTPPTKKAKDPTELGWYEFKYGEAWLIDGDEAAPFKFVPAHKTYSGGNDSWYRGGKPNTGGNFQGSGSGGYIAGLSHITRWTCKPSSNACENPCEGGCVAGRLCSCREQVWKYQGKEYRFDPSDLIRAQQADERRAKSSAKVVDNVTLPAHCKTVRYCADNGECDCTVLGVSPASEKADANGGVAGISPAAQSVGRTFVTDPEPNGKKRCDSCWEYFNESNLCEYVLGAQDFYLCGECAVEDGWGSSVVNQAAKGHGEDDKVLEHWQLVAEAANDAHKKALLATSKNLKCKPDFVQWILFQATIEEIEEGGEELANMRKTIEDEYEENYDEAVPA